METYWKMMKDKAAHHLAELTGWDAPVDEAALKATLAYALRHGDCAEKAEATIESCEWIMSMLMLGVHHA